MSCGIKNIIDVNVMTGPGCCYAGLRCLCQTRHVHWSFHLLCNCRVGMTYVRIVPSFITHSQLLATTTSWCGRQPVERISSQSLQNKYLTFSDLRLSSRPAARCQQSSCHSEPVASCIFSPRLVVLSFGQININMKSPGQTSTVQWRRVKLKQMII